MRVALKTPIIQKTQTPDEFWTIETTETPVK